MFCKIEKTPKRNRPQMSKCQINKEDNKMEENCIFCKIIKGEIPSSKIYEDEEIPALV